MLIETTYFNNQIMFLKCLNNSIYLWHLYVLILFNTRIDIYNTFFHTVYSSF